MPYGKRTYQALFTLLRAGLWEERPEDLRVFPLSDEEWQSLFLLAQAQTVLGLTYRGLDYLPEHLFPQPELLFRWVAEIERIEQRNLDSNESLIGLLKLFGEAGLHPVLQKGQGIATMYHRPLLRTCGDIDLWFPTREEERSALALVREAGCEPLKAPDGSYCYRWHGIEVEHHPSLIDLQSPLPRYHAAKSIRQMEHTMVTLPDHPEQPIATPSAEMNLLLLNAHIMKHAIGLGIGLRQLCDMARAYATLHDRIEGESIRKLYSRAGLRRWSDMLHTFLVGYLGLDPAMLPYRSERTESAEPLFEVVMRGGNFGHYSAEREAARHGTWQRKLNTGRSFLRNCRFSFRYAPGEAVWTVCQLIKGQLA